MKNDSHVVRCTLSTSVTTSTLLADCCTPHSTLMTVPCGASLGLYETRSETPPVYAHTSFGPCPPRALVSEVSMAGGGKPEVMEQAVERLYPVRNSRAAIYAWPGFVLSHNPRSACSPTSPAAIELCGISARNGGVRCARASV